MASKGRPYRTIFVEGYEILIGRAAADNDYLTFHVAERRDLWLHVGSGTPGSHVVIKNPGHHDVPESVIEVAAAAAAWYSKARGSPRVEVHLCHVADVSKPRGAPAGMVELSRWRRLRVAPAAPTGEEDQG